MRATVKMNGKTYRVYTMDVGNGPKVYVDVEVPAGPGAVIVSHYRRAVPRDGKVWNKVMAEAAKQGTE